MEKETTNTIQAFWVGIGSLSSFALGIISAAILSRYFDKAEYGTYRQVLYVYNTLLVVFSAGLPRVFSFYLPRYSLSQGKAIVWKLSKVLFVLGLVFSAFLYFSAELIANVLKNNELAIGLKYFSPIPMLLLPTLGIEGIFSTYKKTIYIAVYNAITRTLMLLFIVLPVILLRGTYLYAIYGWITVSIISFGIAYYFVNIPFKEVEYEKTNLTIKEVFSYSMPLVFASIAGIAIKAADQFYISRYFGPEVFAEFANGFIELPFVTMITGATSVVLMPLFSKAFYETGEISTIIPVWRNALKKSALIIYPLVLFFIVYADEIMVLLYSDKYSTSGRFFQINLLLNFFNIIIFAPLFFSMGKTRIYSNIHIFLAISIWSIDYILILIFNNPVIIAVSSTSLNILKILYFIYLASRLLKIDYLDFFPMVTFLKILGHSSVAIVIVKCFELYCISVEFKLFKMIVVSTLYGVLLIVTAPLMKINHLSIWKSKRSYK